YKTSAPRPPQASMTTTPWKPRVLLVDDEPREIEVMGLVLERQGLEVALASSPAEAITRLGQEDFDAVVTDVVFHGYSDGTRVLEAARKLAPEAIVVLMTGYPAIEGAVSAIKGGALDYLQKPVAPVVLAATIHRALREKRMARNSLSFGELVDILSELVAQTIERVDPYTAGHGERTRKYCRIMADQVGMDVATRERLELAAIAHDYGKIYLDDLTFLTKNGPLTAEEYKEVQRHPLLGAEKLPRHEQLTDVARYVAEHHEKWDGSGYPHRIAGEDISLSGRILGIVEVFDSLSTKRSYKDVWELPKTRQFFSEQRGLAFDPDLLDIFLDLLEVHGEEWLRAPQRDLERAQKA
ncbi:MAG: HD domain-containing phosphohydrolase, partial [Planctomycetota bacterium]|nr:HD domain-containing phosphohydrolase [Planctomycetota bacterium]